MAKNKILEKLQAEFAEEIMRQSQRSDPKKLLAQHCRRYIEIQKKLDQLTAEKDAINSYIKATIPERNAAPRLVDDPKDPNRHYTLVIRASTSDRLDTTLARKFLSDEQVQLCTKTTSSESLFITELVPTEA